MHAVEGFVDAVERGSARDGAAFLSRHATIDDPRDGRITAGEPAERWVERAHAWLAGLAARSEPVRLTTERGRAVLERLLHVRVDGEERELPIAVAADAGNGGLLDAVRIYHSFWTLERRHRLRTRLLPGRDVPLRPPVDAYQRALAAGDVDAVLACYSRNATLREPAGEPFLHRGPRGLRRLYGALLLNGGIELERGAVVDDGVACAVEYTAVRWGRTPLPPQPGMAVYERGATGLIRATRLYDDVDPPRD